MAGEGRCLAELHLHGVVVVALVLAQLDDILLHVGLLYYVVGILAELGNVGFYVDAAYILCSVVYVAFLRDEASVAGSGRCHVVFVVFPARLRLVEGKEHTVVEVFVAVFVEVFGFDAEDIVVVLVGTSQFVEALVTDFHHLVVLYHISALGGALVVVQLEGLFQVVDEVHVDRGVELVFLPLALLVVLRFADTLERDDVAFHSLGLLEVESLLVVVGTGFPQGRLVTAFGSELRVWSVPHVW